MESGADRVIPTHGGTAYFVWRGATAATPDSSTEETLRQANLRADREAAKRKYWQDRALAAPSDVDAVRVAEEIMARIERDGAVHRDALVEVITLYARTGDTAPRRDNFGEAPYVGEGRTVGRVPYQK